MLKTGSRAFCEAVGPMAAPSAHPPGGVAAEAPQAPVAPSGAGGHTRAGGLAPAREVSPTEALVGTDPPAPRVRLPPGLLLPVEMSLRAGVTPGAEPCRGRGWRRGGPQLWWAGGRLPGHPGSPGRCAGAGGWREAGAQRGAAGVPGHEDGAPRREALPGGAPGRHEPRAGQAGG